MATTAIINMIIDPSIYYTLGMGIGGAAIAYCDCFTYRTIFNDLLDVY